MTPPRSAAHDPLEARRVTWLELFFDLVFVAAVAQVGTPLAHDYAAEGLARYAFLLFVIWWAWHGYAIYATRFDVQDARQRALTLCQMVAVIFMAANAEQGLDTPSAAGFAAAYAIVRVVLVLQYLRSAGTPMAKRLAHEHAGGFALAAALWLVSALVDPPLRYALWAAAIGADVGVALLTSKHVATFPPHADHLPERFGLFTLILLGESIVAIIKGIQSQLTWSVPAATSAFAGIALVFICWYVYFEVARAAGERHIRSRRDVRAFEIWNYTHLFLYLGLALTAVGVEHVVTNGGTTTLEPSALWVLCGSAATTMAALALLARTKAPSGITGGPWRFASALALVPLGIPWLGAPPPAAVVATLAALFALQALILRRPTRATDSHPQGGTFPLPAEMSAGPAFDGTGP